MRRASGRKTHVNCRSLFIWALTVLFSIAFIFGFHSFISKDSSIFQVEGVYAEKARIISVGERVSDTYSSEDGTEYTNSYLYFNAELLSGSMKGQKVLAVQTSDDYTINAEESLSPGDKVVLYNYGTKEGDADWIFGGFYRLDALIGFFAAFCLLMVFFGHIKGLNTLISLSFTCLAVFMVFIPAVLAGYNVYLMVFIVCIYTIVMTLLLTGGATSKSLTTILGCSFGVLMAAILEIIFDKILKLTGIIDEHSIYLSYLDSGVILDLKALVFAMIVVGAMGAVMDVAMDISSSLHELHLKAPHLSFKDLYKSGITIGRDVMGTMANTLVLAYIGSNLCSILLLITYSGSLRELLNRENIAVELLQALIGSTAILLTIPLTALVCAYFYTGKGPVKLTAQRDEYTHVVHLESTRTAVISPEGEYEIKNTPVKRRTSDASRFEGFFYGRSSRRGKQDEEK